MPWVLSATGPLLVCTGADNLVPDEPNAMDAFFLGSMAIEGQLGQLLDQILTLAPPIWHAKDVGGKRHLWDHWYTFYGCRARGS